jgi:outer membrane protein TolC
MQRRLYFILGMIVALSCGVEPAFADDSSAIEVGASQSRFLLGDGDAATDSADPPAESEPYEIAPAHFEIPELDLSGRMIISLDEALDIVAHESYAARAARATFERSRFNVDLALAPFDTVLQVTSGMNSAERTGASSLATSSSISTSKSAYYSVGLSERFPSGDRFSISHELARSEISQAGATVQTIPKSYTGSAGFRWTHPLGRGFGRAANWFEVRQALNRQSYEELRLDETARDLRYQTFVLYYTIVSQRQALNVRRTNLEAAIRLLERNYERHKVGLSIRADVLQAINNVLIQKGRIVDDQKRYIDLLDELGLLLGVAQPLDVLPDLDISPTELILDIEEDWPRVRAASAELEDAQTTLRNTELSVGYLRSEMRPDLSLTVDYERQGEAGTAGTAMRNLDDESYSLTLVYNLPWAKRSGKARLAQGEQDLETAKINFERANQELRQEWEGLFRELRSKEVQLELSDSNVTVARENFNIQLERNKVGLAETLDVIQAQESLLEAELGRLNAQIDYQTTYLNILSMVGDI